MTPKSFTFDRLSGKTVAEFLTDFLTDFVVFQVGVVSHKLQVCYFSAVPILVHLNPIHGPRGIENLFTYIP